MAKYIARNCPKCRDYFGLVLNQPPQSNGEHPINGFCAVWGYQLKGWRLILGRKRMVNVYHGKMPKVFSLVDGPLLRSPMPPLETPLFTHPCAIH
jgi:hypothetical protein